MHELGIANAVLEAARAEIQCRPGMRLRKVIVRVGELAGVNPEALSFCFEVLVRDSDLAPVELEIEYCPRRQRCQLCGKTFAVEDYDFSCPVCHSPQTQYESGDELELAYLEVEENEPSAARA